jgi:hypothetical protein
MAAEEAVFSHHATILVLDYGSQYTQLIARRIRDQNVLSMLVPGDVTLVSRYSRVDGWRRAHLSFGITTTAA